MKLGRAAVKGSWRKKRMSARYKQNQRVEQIEYKPFEKINKIEKH